MRIMLRAALAATLLAGLLPGVASAQSVVQGADQTFGQPASVQVTASDGKKVKAPGYVPIGIDGAAITGATLPTGAATSANQTATGASAQTMQGNSASGATDTGNGVKVAGVYNTTAPTFTNAQRGDMQLDSNGNLRARLVASIGTATDGVGNGAIGYLAATNASGGINLLGTANWAFNGTGWDRVPGNIYGSVVQMGAAAVGSFTTATSSSTAVEAGRVAKAAAGNLYGMTITTGASAGYVMAVNSATVPADGAVAPLYCAAVAANTTLDKVWNMPIFFSTGVTVVFSTTGCFTKTGSATAYFSIQSK